MIPFEQQFIENEKTTWENVGEGIERQIMTYTNSLMMVKVAFQKGSIGTLHSHHHTQISYVESGVFEVSIAEEKRILRAGDAFFVPPNVAHEAVCLETGMLIDVFTPMREDFL